MMALIWFLLFLSTLFAWFLSPSTALLFVWCLIIAVPVLSWLPLWFIKKKQHITLDCPTVAGKGMPITLSIALPQESFPIGNAVVWLSIENSVTGEIIRRRFRMTKSASLTLESQHCGGLHCRITKVWALDFFGLLPLSFPCRAEKRITVMPVTFPVTAEDLRLLADADECQEYAPDHRGQDPSETFQIRSYVPGDNLHQIHWKLSEKSGELLIRESSCPVDHSLLLFIDRRCNSVVSQLSDALMEAAVSVAQGLTDAGIPFLLGWNELQIHQHAVTCSDQLPAITAELLQSPQICSGPSGCALWMRSDQRIGRVLYFCHQLPNEGENFNAPTQTFLFADSASSELDTVSPENMKDLFRRLSGGDF